MSTRETSGRLIFAGAILSALATGSPVTAEQVDNAALLYYQAFIRCPSYSEFPEEVVRNLMGGDLSEENLQRYVEKNRVVIELMEAGSRMNRCDWGVPPLLADGFGLQILGCAKPVIMLVCADARALAARGDYHRAFARLLTLRRFAVHVTHDPNLADAAPLFTEQFVIGLAGRILGTMPPDKETVAWLKAELVYEPAIYDGSIHVLWASHRQRLRFLRTDDKSLRSIRSSAEKYKEGQEAWEQLGDDELLRLIAEPHAEFLKSVAELLAADMRHPQRYARLQELVDGFMKEPSDNPVIAGTWAVQVAQAAIDYDVSIRVKAQFNALRAALEVYLAVAEKGQLPEALPSTSPKDPLSGDDFEYERTPTGFTFRSPVKAFEHLGPWEFSCKVHDPGE